MSVKLPLKKTERAACQPDLDFPQGLWLHGNVLKELPEDFGNLKQLETISLAGNQIERLPASLAELKQLKDLSLSGNLLKELPSAIGELGEVMIKLLPEK